MDWTNPKDHVTPHFTVADACLLHAFNRLGTPTDGMDPAKLIVLCQKMEEIRELLGYPINVHCMFRSPEYNLKIGAPAHDPHSTNAACDFDCNPHLTIAQVQGILEPKLEALGIRMERNTATWCHIDLWPVGHNRFFYV
jgi:Peptidase M15